MQTAGKEGPLGDAPVFFLHGGATQQERTKAFFAFCKTAHGVLFCTDVAARGLDMPKVTLNMHFPFLWLQRALPLACADGQVAWIVQAQAPASVAEYIHRVGRTARLEASGRALLLLLPSEVLFVTRLQSHALRCDASPFLHLHRLSSCYNPS
jgi:ATP-dependent RNA helicase DDX31/DBP7